MRFIAIVKASEQSEAGVMPTEKELAEMGAFNEELVKAGVMLAGVYGFAGLAFAVENRQRAAVQPAE